MRKRNKVAQLHRTAEHREAMLGNMITSLLYHEQIKTTVAKAKVTRQKVEKIITRAKKNLGIEDAGQKLHNVRQVAKVIDDKEVLNKLFNDIAPRYAERNGGYTRILRLGKRVSDNSEMAIIELVEKKPLAQLKDERKAMREGLKKGSKKTETVEKKK